MSPSLEDRVAKLEAEVRLARDKQEIYNSLMLYCRGIDRCVPEVVSQVWPAQNIEVAKRVTDWLRANPKVTMHYVGNCQIEVDGDEAESEAYMIAYHVYDVDGVEKLRVKAMRDLRTWKRTDAGWVTVDRGGRDEWNWFARIEERAPGADQWVYGERGPEDATFHIREALEADRGRPMTAAGYPGLKAWDR
jgi:hypothetical protein